MVMVTLIHPSRGRAKKAFDTYNYWISQSSEVEDIQHILSIDNDDSERQEYFNLCDAKTLIVCNTNTCVVEATNHAAKYVKGEILVYLSDDFRCPLNWDLLILSRLKNINTPQLLKIDDCLQPFNNKIATMPIMSIGLYKELGYFFNPLYKSMFADADLFSVCKNNDWIIEALELKFPHEHHSLGKTEMDETYRRSEIHFEDGKKIFEQRALNGFQP